MYGYKVQTSFQPKGRDASGSTLPGDVDSFGVRSGDTLVDGAQGATNPDAPLAKIRISRNEAEVLFRYWFERLRKEEEFCYVYQCKKNWEESDRSSIRLDELQPHVSKEFLDEIATEVRTRNEQANRDRDSYCNSEDPYAKSPTEVESVGG